MLGKARWNALRARGGMFRAGRFRLLHGSAVACVCLVLLAVTALVATWLQPVRRPHLLLISSDSVGSPLLPPSSFVTDDSRALIGLDSVFDTSDADSDSLGLGEMQTLVGQLTKSSPRSRWFSWQKTTTLVYVNALGLSVRHGKTEEPVAYLLPDDFGATLGVAGFPTDKAIPMTAVLERLAQSDADQKVLVLDCQRTDHHWPLGVMANEFVAAVQSELQRNAERYQGMVVMFSCSPGEVSWSGNSFRHSAFAYYFLRGITGAADSRGGNGDRRVTADELSAYIHGNVTQWAAGNRADEQHPLIQAVGVDPAEVVLAALDPGQVVYDQTMEVKSGPDVSPELDQQITQLKEAWKNYYDLSHQERSVVSYAPHLWRRLEDTLLRAEAYFRCDNHKAMGQELRKITFCLGAIKDAQNDQVLKSAAYSIPMSQLFRQLAPEKQRRQETEAAGNLERRPEENVVSASALTEEDLSVEQEEEEQPATQTEQQLSAPGSPKPASPSELAKSPKPPTAPPAAGAPVAGAPVAGAKNPPPTGPGVSQKANQEAGGESETVSPTEFEQIIAAALRGPEPLDRIGRRLQEERFERPVIPVEAEFLRMLARGWPAEHLVDSSRDVTLRAHHLLSYRVLAEQAAVPAGENAHRVFPWIRGWVDAADRFRRRREDDFFALPGRQVQIGGALTAFQEEDSDLYRESLRSAKSLAEAFLVKDRITAELPHLTRLSAMRDWKSESNTFRDQVDELTFQLLMETRDLSQKLYATPENWDSQQRRQNIAEVVTVSRRIQTTRERVLRIIGKEFRKLCRSESTVSAGSNAVWRRADAILTLPYAYSTEPSVALASRRIQLLRKTKLAVEKVSEIRPGKTEQTESVARNIYSADADRTSDARRLAHAFFSLAGAIDEQRLRGEREGTGYSEAVAEAWLTAYEAATSPQLQQDRIDRLIQADTACRILESYPVAAAFRSYRDLPTQVLRRREMASLCAWHGLRLAEDFWAGGQNADDFYFHKAATHYLNLARELFPQRGTSYVELESRLKELHLVAKKLRKQDSGDVVFAQPVRLVFRGTDSLVLSHAIDPSESCPPGIGRLRCLPGEQKLTVRDLPDRQTDYPLPYQISRPPGVAVSSAVTAEFFYRGHICQRSFHIHGAGDEAGPTINISDQRPDDAECLIRLAEVNAAPANLLFVLDCSRSMLEDGRMLMLRETLGKFARIVRGGTLNVGVRVFGDQVVWQQFDLKSEQAAKKDSRTLLKIQPFHRSQFLNLLPNLQARGESPLFHALLQTPGDFSGVQRGEKIVILVSDGADNWAAVGEKPGVAELTTALGTTDITINAIGFQTDDAGYRQLEAATGATGGSCIRAERSDQLLESLVSMARILKYTITSRPDDNSNPVVVHSGPLDYEATSVKLPPGTYDFSIIGPSEELITARRKIKIRRGERHEFLYGGGQLNYPPLDLSADIAVTRDEKAGVMLRVLRAEQKETDLILEFALAARRNPAWYPRQVKARIKPREGENAYAFQDVTANVPGYHFPVWRVRLRDWKRSYTYADLDVSWAETDDGEQKTFTIAWDDPISPETLPKGLSVSRREFKPQMIDGKIRNTATAAIVFPENYRRVQDWSLNLSQPVEFSRRTYNLLDGVHTSHFVLPDESRPRTVTIRGPHAPRKKMRTAINLRAKKIN